MESRSSLGVLDSPFSALLLPYSRAPSMEWLQLHPSSLVLLFVFLFVLVFLSSAQEEECAPSLFECGSVKHSISYPFWKEGRSKHCAYEEYYKITCNETDNSSEIEIESRKYHVKEIDYENQTAIIVDKDYFGDSSSCHLPSTSTIDLNPNHFNYPTNGDFNLTFLYNCLPPIINDPDIKFLECLRVDELYAYLTFQPYNIPVPETFKGCQVIKTPILEANRYGLEESPEGFGDVLAQGFQVTWSVIDPYRRCLDCVRSRGHCGFNETSHLDPTCYCNGQRHPATCPRGGDNTFGRSSRFKIIIGATIGAGIFFLTCIFVLHCRRLPANSSIFFWKEKTCDAHNVNAFLENYRSLGPKRYRYSKLKKMTNSFKDKLGQGGYGGVFKGKLDDGRLVAVKVLDSSKGTKGEEFINEVASIGRTYHVNVVILIGFCSEGSKRALVYEFMSNGSLEKFIYSEKPETRCVLDCHKLFQISVGIARGLEYLHRGCSTRILHLDIKPHNILLDDEFCPKISDFGLAKICPQQESIVTMLHARGTVGYIAPEVYCRNIGGVSHKSDVYSYGMMVLEMAGKRKNIDAKVENTSEIYFPHWVYNHIETLGLLGITTEAEEEIARKMILVGLWCIQTDPTIRPSMSKVVEMLEGSLESLQMPPKPYLSSPSRTCSSTA